jgi:hypothetical protein
MELIRIAADDNDLSLAAFTRVYGAFIVAAAADVSALIYDALTVTGTEKFGIAALAKTTSPYLDFGETGTPFRTGISVDITGAGAVLYLLVG